MKAKAIRLDGEATTEPEVSVARIAIAIPATHGLKLVKRQAITRRRRWRNENLRHDRTVVISLWMWC
jgi:hypothetical protein